MCFAARTLVAHVLSRASSVGGEPPSAGKVQQDRARSCARAVQRLQAAGVPLRPEGGAAQYERLHAEWDTASAALRRHFGYDEDGRRQERG